MLRHGGACGIARGAGGKRARRPLAALAFLALALQPAAGMAAEEAEQRLPLFAPASDMWQKFAPPHSKSAVFAARRAGVKNLLQQAPAASVLFPANYAPSPAVFGDIRDDKPWQTSALHNETMEEAFEVLETLDTVGLGLSKEEIEEIKNNMEAPEESGLSDAEEMAFYAANPHLLIVGVETKDGRYVAPTGDTLREIPNLPLAEAWLGKKHVRVVYRNTFADRWMRAFLFSSVVSKNVIMEFASINARDAGFEYAMLDAENSANVDINECGGLARAPTPLASRALYNKGKDANIVGGGAPQDARLMLVDGKAGVTLRFKLWRQKPANAKTPADFEHIIEAIPTAETAWLYETVYDDPSAWPLRFMAFLDRIFWLSPCETMDDYEAELGGYDPQDFEPVAMVFDFFNYGLPLLLLLAGWAVGKHNERRHYKQICRREAALAGVPVLSSWHYDEARPVARATLAFGEVVVANDYFKRLLAAIRNLAGGEVKAYSSILDRARREAILRMKESQPDADVFVNLRLSHAVISFGGLEATATATAIKYQ